MAGSTFILTSVPKTQTLCILFQIAIFASSLCNLQTFNNEKHWKIKGCSEISQEKREQNIQICLQLQALSTWDYRGYEMLLSQIEVGNECVVGQFDEVCDGYFIYKEILCFIDYMNFV